MGDAPFMYWVGMNTAAATSPQELAEFNDFYSHTHMHEVVVSHAVLSRPARSCGSHTVPYKGKAD